MSGRSPISSKESETTSSYTPAVGDVVEFDSQRTDKTARAIVFVTSVYRSRLVCLDDSDFSWWDYTDSLINPRKVGETDVLVDTKDTDTARALAKAYFAQEPKCTYGTELDKPQYKVGDLVESEQNIDTIYEVLHFNDDGNVDVRTNDHLHYAVEVDIFRPLSGTYAERQAKWLEFHGLKVGDKVKVVRKFGAGEDGYDSRQWNFDDDKAKMQGGIFEIEDITAGNIQLHCPYDRCKWHFPYCVLEPVAL